MKVLVTGGGGFLGAALVRSLRARGDEVTALGRGRYPALEALGASCLPWDLSRETPGLSEALKGFDAVIHTAARAGIWGPHEDFHAINVDGTLRVIAACVKAGVPKLVFTGSPSCTFDGLDHKNATEADCPYPMEFMASYPETKALAERLVLQASSPDLATTSLRPHLIWGPGDPHLMPRVVQKNRQGRLAIVGDGQNKVGLTYIENAVTAHLQALDALSKGSKNAGKAYFITDPEPVLLWSWINSLLRRMDEPEITRKIPLELAELAGRILEGAWELFGLDGEPPMTPFVASQLATSHWYNLSAARADFGYAPTADLESGLAATAADLKARFPR